MRNKFQGLQSKGRGKANKTSRRARQHMKNKKRKDIQNIATKQPLYSLLLYTHCTDYTCSVGPVHSTTDVESPLEMTIHAPVKVEYIQSLDPKEHGTITE